MSIGTERKDLVIIEKTTNEKELLRTKEIHMNSLMKSGVKLNQTKKFKLK